MSLREMPTLQHTSTTKTRANSSVAVMLREMQREVNTGHPFQSTLHIEYSTNNHATQLHAANDIDCCFMTLLSWRKAAGRRIMIKLWSMPGKSANLRGQMAELPEQPADKKGEKHRRHFARAGSLKNRDLWLRPTDMSCRFPILMTIREEPFKNYRSRTSEKWKATEDKIEEAKKQKIKKNDDERSYANWQTSSWSWHQPMTWTSSSWQQWSSDETRERSDCQPSAGWNSSDQTRERSEWRSAGSWQSPFSWQ